MTECTEWTGPRDKKGYGRTWFRGKTERAHRAVWAEKYGAIPPGMCVCHRCDNPGCVNLAHLFMGTNADNVQDKVSKNRQYRKPSKLTSEQIQQIRAARRGEIRKLCREIGIHHTYALDIRKGAYLCD